jgi:hypothetical protein
MYNTKRKLIAQSATAIDSRFGGTTTRARFDCGHAFVEHGIARGRLRHKLGDSTDCGSCIMLLGESALTFGKFGLSKELLEAMTPAARAALIAARMATK